jgi:hypothetical protein
MEYDDENGMKKLFAPRGNVVRETESLPRPPIYVPSLKPTTARQERSDVKVVITVFADDP